MNRTKSRSTHPTSHLLELMLQEKQLETNECLAESNESLNLFLSKRAERSIPYRGLSVNHEKPYLKPSCFHRVFAATGLFLVLRPFDAHMLRTRTTVSLQSSEVDPLPKRCKGEETARLFKCYVAKRQPPFLKLTLRADFLTV